MRIFVWSPGCEGPISSHVNFKCLISKSDWEQIRPHKNPKIVSDRKYAYCMPKENWPHIFSQLMMEVCPEYMKGCVVNFKNHFVRKNSTGKFVTATGYCSRKSPKQNCEMKYTMSIRKEPTKTFPFELLVRYWALDANFSIILILVHIFY